MTSLFWLILGKCALLATVNVATVLVFVLLIVSVVKKTTLSWMRTVVGFLLKDAFPVLYHGASEFVVPKPFFLATACIVHCLVVGRRDRDSIKITCLGVLGVVVWSVSFYRMAVWLEVLAPLDDTPFARSRWPRLVMTTWAIVVHIYFVGPQSFHRLKTFLANNAPSFFERVFREQARDYLVIPPSLE